VKQKLAATEQQLGKVKQEKDDAYTALLNDKCATESNLQQQIEFFTLEKENMVRDGEFINLDTGNISNIYFVNSSFGEAACIGFDEADPGQSQN
jgi:hypothetical protein